MVQTTILNAISSGNVTVEQIKANTHLSPKAIEIGIKELVENGIIAIDGNGNYYNCYSYGGSEVTPKTTSTNKTGDNMKTQNNSQATGSKTSSGINCTPEQRAFANSVCRAKGKIFDAQKEGTVFTHRGAEVLFGGAGNKSLRYKIAISGFSDKEAVEYAVLYLDWDDTALYEQGGLADQIKEVIGADAPGIKIAPAITAGVGGK